MSTSQSIKSDLCKRKVYSKESQFLCFYGILITLKKCSEKEIVFTTANADTAKLFENFCISFAHEKGCTETVGQKKGSLILYKISIISETARSTILSAFHLNNTDRETLDIDRNFIDNVLAADFFAGVFLSCGNLTEPEKSYHLEMVLPFEKTALDIKILLEESFWQEGVKLITRRGKYVLYMKGSERISDFLTYIGLSDAAIDYYNTEIYKNVRNKANRIANCDAANIERAVDAGLKQFYDIELIYAAGKRGKLPQKLRETADLRLENPQMTLKELSESLAEISGEPVTRSCINHRLKKLSLMAENLRENNEFRSSSR
ncbi:MAG: DNA-binding protein WhiA [Ruminococcus sp.]|jgi:DNA-binding protein WhiA|nr:DNA-binding protein WhiA [Ruminococcus sp.]